MSRTPSSRALSPARPLLALGLLALLPACVVGDRASGVLPTEPVAPPPFMRSGAAAEAPAPRPANRREAARRERLERPDGTRLSQPDAGASRRVRREDIEGEEPRSGGGGSVAPVISGGGIGLGGRF